MHPSCQTLDLMHGSLSAVNSPPISLKLWRYMSLGKFLSLLATSRLYFPRIDCLPDEYEGTWPSATVAAALKDSSAGNRLPMLESTEQMRSACFVSCWAGLPNESAGLWEIYAKNDGVAVHTTVADIRASLVDRSHLLIGAVNYVDFADVQPLTLNPYRVVFMKRVEFQHEAEVRLMTFSQNSNTPTQLEEVRPRFAELEVSLGRLLKGVLLAPNSPAYLLPSIRETVRKFGLNPDIVVQSRIYTKPSGRAK